MLFLLDICVGLYTFMRSSDVFGYIQDYVRCRIGITLIKWKPDKGKATG